MGGECSTCEREGVGPQHVELAEEGLDLEQQETVENKKAKLEAKLTDAGANIRTTFRLLDADRYFHTRCSALISPSLTTCRIDSIYSNHSPVVQTHTYPTGSSNASGGYNRHHVSFDQRERWLHPVSAASCSTAVRLCVWMYSLVYARLSLRISVS